MDETNMEIGDIYALGGKVVLKTDFLGVSE